MFRMVLTAFERYSAEDKEIIKTFSCRNNVCIPLNLSATLGRSFQGVSMTKRTKRGTPQNMKARAIRGGMGEEMTGTTTRKMQQQIMKIATGTINQACKTIELYNRNGKVKILYTTLKMRGSLGRVTLIISIPTIAKV